MTRCGFSQVDDDATPGEIKMAYRGIAKECHPDYLGEEGHNICILLNEASSCTNIWDSDRLICALGMHNSHSNWRIPSTLNLDAQHAVLLVGME